MNNQYTELTDYYDLWVQSGYYDYRNKASLAQSIVGKGRQVLELGVGTGLLAEQYLSIDPECQFTGVDFTASMLKIAREKVGEKVDLVEADVVTMDLGTKFDAAISNGGVWVMYDCDDHWEVGSLIPDADKNLPGLVNVAHHLKSDGILLLNVQRQHDDFEKHLTPDIIYSQTVDQLEDASDYYSVQKTYTFIDKGEVSTKDKHKITYFKDGSHQKMFDSARFEFVEISPEINGDSFAVFRKQ